MRRLIKPLLKLVVALGILASGFGGYNYLLATQEEIEPSRVGKLSGRSKRLRSNLVMPALSILLSDSSGSADS